MRTVGEVAALAGVSVRTLHHYDELGLVVPSGRSDAGYRLYDHADLERLQEVLTLRALGLPLAGVAAVLDDPAHDRVQVLRDQAKRLRDEQDRLAGLLTAVEEAIAAHDRGTPQQESTMFDGHDHEQYAREAEERWGDTDAYRQSRERVGALGPGAEEQIKAWWQEHFEQFAALRRDEVPLDDDRVRTAVADHRALLNRFYDCGAEMQKGIAEMYVADPRFAATYDEHVDGLAQYVRDAVHAHADAI